MSSLRLNRRHFLAGASGGAVLGVLGSPAKAWASVEVAPTTLGENLIVGPIAEISLPNRLAVDMFLKGPGPQGALNCSLTPSTGATMRISTSVLSRSVTESQ